MDGVQVTKALIFTVRTCYRSVCRHPFFVGVLFFLILVSRSFPFLFSVFVSASPVLVSTAVLLGALLSFGDSNIPEIEYEEETNHEISSLQTRVLSDGTIFERCGSYSLERCSVIRGAGDSSSTASSSCDVGQINVLADSELLIEEKSREFQFEKWETKGESKSRDIVFDSTCEPNEGDGELLLDLYSLVQQLDERSLGELGNAKSPEGYLGTETLEWTLPPVSPRKHVDGVKLENTKPLEDYVGAEAVDRSSPDSPSKHEDNGEEENDDVSDSESDGGESSSPDASIVDIIPLLNELHPLTDEVAPQHGHMFSERCDSTSENSSELGSDGSIGLEEDMENYDNDIESADDEEEKESPIENTVEVKSDIRWTDVDLKNLMDVGNSELDRNQRLEHLIAKRRLRKSMVEKNLIDFDSTDLPVNIAHIATARHNKPFDLTYDDDMRLAPMPGSVPSILLPRSNPVNLPYHLSEEKTDLMMGDNFHQDAMRLQSKEPVFRRNETFNVGPSLFRSCRHKCKFKPYFVTERMNSEEYTSFHRQSGDLCDSRASSVPEADSVSLEDKKPIEEDLFI